MQIVRIFSEESNETTLSLTTILSDIFDNFIESYYSDFKVNSTTSSEKEDV